MKPKVEQPTKYKGIDLQQVQQHIASLRMFALNSSPKASNPTKKLEWSDYYQHLTQVKQSLDLAQGLEWMFLDPPDILPFPPDDDFGPTD